MFYILLRICFYLWTFSAKKRNRLSETGKGLYVLLFCSITHPPVCFKYLQKYALNIAGAPFAETFASFNCVNMTSIASLAKKKFTYRNNKTTTRENIITTK